MPTEEETGKQGMAGASGQRWEPADEGVIVEAAEQVPEDDRRPPPPAPEESDSYTSPPADHDETTRDQDRDA